MNSFVKSPEQLSTLGGNQTVFLGAKMLTVYWETKPEIIRKILPKCLEPAAIPLVNAFIADYPKTSFCPPYREAGLFVLAEKDGVVGNYCLSMPITDGMAMAMGREICGLPKKMADIQISDEGKKFKGSIKRNNITFFSVEGDSSGKMNDAKGESVINQYIGEGLPMYNVKYSKAVDGSGFDLPPTLVRQKIVYKNEQKILTSCNTEFNESPHDPWGELEVVKMLGGVYTIGDNILERGENLGRIHPMEYVPYSFIRWDWWGK